MLQSPTLDQTQTANARAQTSTAKAVNSATGTWSLAAETQEYSKRTQTQVTYGSDTSS